MIKKQLELNYSRIPQRYNLNGMLNFELFYMYQKYATENYFALFLSFSTDVEAGDWHG